MVEVVKVRAMVGMVHVVVVAVMVVAGCSMVLDGIGDGIRPQDESLRVPSVGHRTRLYIRYGKGLWFHPSNTTVGWECGFCVNLACANSIFGGLRGTRADPRGALRQVEDPICDPYQRDQVIDRSPDAPARGAVQADA